MATRSASVVNDDRFKIFSGTANPILAESICRHLDVPLGKALLGRFSDGEIYFQILENVRGADVFVVQPCHAPVDSHLLDLLAPQIQGYFDVPVDHLYGSPVLVEHFRQLNLPNLTVVSPDAGGVERARFFAKKLDAPLAIVDKRRVAVDVSEVMNLIGDVRGRSTLIVDDIIDTAGTLVKTAEALAREGATQVYAACTHA